MAENIDLSMLDVLDPQDLDHEQKVIYLSCVPKREKGVLAKRVLADNNLHTCTHLSKKGDGSLDVCNPMWNVTVRQPALTYV